MLRDRRNYSLPRRFLFIHIPKTAGTSVCHALGFDIPTSHRTALEYKEILGKDFATLYKFCFVRNPWDRFFSLYYYVRMEKSYFHNSRFPLLAVFGKHPDYDLVKNASPLECAELLVAGKLSSQWRPQTDFIYDSDGKLLVDFVGRFENLAEDFTKISECVKGTKTLEHYNASENLVNDYRTLCDAKTQALIEKHYQKDIQDLGYSF